MLRPSAAGWRGPVASIASRFPEHRRKSSAIRGRRIADRKRLRAYPVAAASLDSIRQTIALVPRRRQAQIIRTWTGIEGIMPDGIPVLGPSRTTSGLFHAFGFSGHGFQLGPAVRFVSRAGAVR
jgi:glycine/D-amino acid oxidase-like deaminating enzyme